MKIKSPPQLKFKLSLYQQEANEMTVCVCVETPSRPSLEHTFILLKCLYFVCKKKFPLLTFTTVPSCAKERLALYFTFLTLPHSSPAAAALITKKSCRSQGVFKPKRGCRSTQKKIEENFLLAGKCV
jgi:hypothetical protein